MDRGTIRRSHSCHDISLQPRSDKPIDHGAHRRGAAVAMNFDFSFTAAANDQLLAFRPAPSTEQIRPNGRSPVVREPTG